MLETIMVVIVWAAGVFGWYWMWGKILSLLEISLSSESWITGVVLYSGMIISAILIIVISKFLNASGGGGQSTFDGFAHFIDKDDD